MQHIWLDHDSEGRAPTGQAGSPGRTGLSHLAEDGSRELVGPPELGDFPSRVAPHHDPAAPFNIVLFHGGDNDIAAGRTAGQAADSLGRYVALAHAQGWTVIVSTELGRPDWSPSAQAALAEYNVLELRNAAGADLVIDYANASGMADPDARASGGLYNADGVHPSAAGYAVLADLLRQAIATVRSRG